MEWELNWVLNKSRYIAIYGAKTSKNCRKTKSRERKREEPAALGRTAMRHPTRALVGPLRSVLSRSAAFCAPLVVQFGPRVLPMLGHFGPPLQAFVII